MTRLGDTPGHSVGPGAAFASAPHANLAAAGLSGTKVDVRYADGALHLAGASGGSLIVDTARAERIRLGYLNGKYVRVHYARIWLAGSAEPLVLEPVERETPAYGHAMRAFAHDLAAARGIASVERGLSTGTAAFALLFPMLPLAIGIVLPVFIPALQSAWMWGGLVAIGLLLAIASVVHFFKRQRPQPVSDLQEIEAQLP